MPTNVNWTVNYYVIHSCAIYLNIFNNFMLYFMAMWQKDIVDRLVLEVSSDNTKEVVILTMGAGTQIE